MNLNNLRFPRYRKVLLLTTAFLLIFCYLSASDLSTIVGSDLYYYLNPMKDVFCHAYTNSSLPDISDESPRKDMSIFFHETSCNSYFNGKIVISPRQACAVESAARMNPNHDVFLLFASPGLLKFDNTESDRILGELLRYENVKLRHVDLARYVKNTPVEKLWNYDALRHSAYALSHTSDVLRYLTLWKYGGIYLDLDVVVIKNLEDLGTNYAGLESENNVAAGILSFDHSQVGRKFANACIYDIANNFRGNDWGYNGPGVITRMLKKACDVDTAKDMINKDCEGFTVYPPEAFYAVPWWDWTMFFEQEYTENLLNLTNNSHIIHVWNKNSVNNQIPLDSNVSYLQYAKKYCPKTIQQCDAYF